MSKNGGLQSGLQSEVGRAALTINCCSLNFRPRYCGGEARAGAVLGHYICLSKCQGTGCRTNEGLWPVPGPGAGGPLSSNVHPPAAATEYVRHLFPMFSRSVFIKSTRVEPQHSVVSGWLQQKVHYAGVCVCVYVRVLLQHLAL